MNNQKFDIYKSASRSRTRESEADQKAFMAITESAHVAECIRKFRAGDEKAKRQLPAWTPMGKTTTGTRAIGDMTHTGLVMVDIDHIGDGQLQPALEALMNLETISKWDILLVHITPSGKGLRIVFPLPKSCDRIETAQEQFVKELALDGYGDFDGVCKDLTRLSFFPQRSDIKFISEGLFFERAHLQTTDDEVVNAKVEEPQATEGTFTDFKYGGHLVRDIVDAYVMKKGEPGEGGTHLFYNSLVRNFRHICDNNPDILIDVLPLFGQTRANRYSQCKSICKRNDSALIPKEFYFFLKENGYLPLTKDEKEDIESEDADPYREEYEMLDRMPSLPPVFREYVNAAPKEFKIPTIFALLPILGTLTTYLESDYIDGEIHTTEFLTIIFAQASQGKSFVNKFLRTEIEQDHPSNLLQNICRRDFITQARERIYQSSVNTKGANEKSSKLPRVSIRIASPIISQPELLTKMQDNQRMHMFTFAPEMDTFSKGARAGGGDKNDMYRVAWDNGPYSQQFKSTSTFKGTVNLYLNALITGTPDQCKKFFKDIENGLVTRCSFTDLGCQDFRSYQPWTPLTKDGIEVIGRFKQRCDSNTYTEPLVFDTTTLDDYTTEEAFDKAVPWQYQFRGRQHIDLSYVKDELLKWLDKERVKAAENVDYARDMFRKRSAVKAFRLALLCNACWPKITKTQRETIKNFALWFADLDLMKELKRWGEEYNTFRQNQSGASETTSTNNFKSLFESMPEEFTKVDVNSMAKQMGIHTKVRMVIYRWKSAGLIKKVDTSTWKKTNKTN